MQVQIEEVSPVETKLIVSVPWDNVNDKLGKSYRELGKQVHLKGFRKGKVPRSVLERMFHERVHAEVTGELVRESFMTALSEHKLQAVAEPRVEQEISITKGQTLSFEAIVEVKGEIKVDNYKGMELFKRPLVIDEEELEHTLSHLRKDHMDLLPIEDRSTLSTDDMVTISLKGTIGDQEIDRPEMNLDLGDDHHEPLPGMHAALVGLPIDATDHEITINIAEDHKDALIAGKTAKFTVSVIDAKYKDLPELNDEFAKDTGRADTLDELVAGIRKEAEEREAEEIKTELSKAAVDELIKRNPIAVASSLTERIIQNRFQQLQSMMGIAPGEQNFPLDAETRERLSEGAEEEVRGQLLLDALAQAEELKASEEEIDARVAEIASHGSKSVGRLKAEMARDGRLENIRYQLEQDKAVALLLEHATIVEKEPAAEHDPEEGASEKSDEADSKS